MNPNNLELNKGDDFIVALDISGSMGTFDCPGGANRITYLLETLKVFVVEAFKYDTDGVSFYPFGATLYKHPDLTPEQFDTTLSKYLTSLEGMTNTHLAIEAAYAEHVERSNEQTFLLVFTDGAPNDRQAVEDAIINITKSVKDSGEFRIAFITVGVANDDLSAWLKSLDDDLKTKGAVHDIVDVKRLEDVNFATAISGALVD